MTPPEIMIKQAEAMAELLKLIANPNRLMIACRLLDGELSVSDIERELGITQPTLSREIGRLRDGGIITARRQSKAVFYTFAHPKMERIIRALCAANSDAPTPAASSAALRADTAAHVYPSQKFTAAAGRAVQKAGGYSQFATVKAAPSAEP